MQEENTQIPREFPEAPDAPRPDLSAPTAYDARVNPDSANRRFCRRSRTSRLRGAWRMFRVTLATTALMAAGFLIYLWMGMAAAVRIVEKQVAAIRDGRIDDAYQLFSESYRAENSLPMFRAWVARHDEFSRAQDMRIWSRSMRSERAVLWGVVQDFRGQGYPVRFRMIREGGAWRIDELTMRRSWAEDSLDELPRASFI